MDGDKAADVLGWCVVELMGRRRLTGYVTPVELAGAGFLRVDVPAPGCQGTAGPWQATQYIAPASVYAITPTTADLAIRAAGLGAVAPVSRWELPAAGDAVPARSGIAAFDDAVPDPDGEDAPDYDPADDYPV